MALKEESDLCKKISGNKMFEMTSKIRRYEKNGSGITRLTLVDRTKTFTLLALVEEHALAICPGKESSFTCSHVELSNSYHFTLHTEHYLHCLAVRVASMWNKRRAFTIFSNEKLKSLDDFSFIKLVHEYNGNSGHVWVYIIETDGLLRWIGDPSITQPAPYDLDDDDDDYWDENDE